jgi:hypothetical protein
MDDKSSNTTPNPKTEREFNNREWCKHCGKFVRGIVNRVKTHKPQTGIAMSAQMDCNECGKLIREWERKR